MHECHINSHTYVYISHKFTYICIHVTKKHINMNGCKKKTQDTNDKKNDSSKKHHAVPKGKKKTQQIANSTQILFHRNPLTTNTQNTGVKYVSSLVGYDPYERKNQCVIQ